MDYFILETFSPLYEAVQTSNLFADSKFFVDCTPIQSPNVILKIYEQENKDANFNLKTFVDTYFEPPQNPQNDYQTGNKNITTHLHGLWDVLTRYPTPSHKSSLIPLPYPYIVPGGRFREIYYWDSYFSMLGLKASNRLDLIENMTNNFAYLIDKLGFIPNGNRSYYLGRSQPPFFSYMVSLLCDLKKNCTLSQYLPQLEKEYAFFMRDADTLACGTASHRVVRLPDGELMNRYWDEQTTPRPEAFSEDCEVAAEASNTPPSVTYQNIRAACESGWDFSSRWLADGQHLHTIETTNLLPIDLNCLILHLEEILLCIYQQYNEQNLMSIFEQKVAARREAIQKYHWNESEGFYFDYHHLKGEQTTHWTLAALFPLFTGVATPQQAQQVANIIADKFLYEGGLVTTIYHSGQQWDAPNGWAPLQWVAIAAFRRYGLDELATKIAKNWVNNCEKVFANTGKMMEKYNVMNTQSKAGGGEYPNQDGFGWTNGVYLACLFG